MGLSHALDNLRVIRSLNISELGLHRSQMAVGLRCTKALLHHIHVLPLIRVSVLLSLLHRWFKLLLYVFYRCEILSCDCRFYDYRVQTQRCLVLNDSLFVKNASDPVFVKGPCIGFTQILLQIVARLGCNSFIRALTWKVNILLEIAILIVGNEVLALEVRVLLNSRF